MPDVRLHRPDRTRSTGDVGAPECLRQARDLDRVAECRAGAVSFDVADVGRRHARLPPRLGDDPLLRVRVGHRVAVRLATVVDRAAEDETVDVVAVGEGLPARLEQHRTDALAGHVAVTAGTERPAPAVAGDVTALAQEHVLVGVHRNVYPTRDRQLALASAQALAREVQGGERRRAHRVQRQARALEVEEVRHPVRDRGVRRVGDRTTATQRVHRPVELVLAVHDADEDPDRPPTQIVPAVARVLDHVPGGLQEQPFLRVHQVGFPRHDREEERVELVHIGQEAAPPRVGGAEALPFGVEEPVVVPSVRGDLGDAVAPLGEVLPELVHIVGHRIAAGQPDDRDGVVVVVRPRGERVGVGTGLRGQHRLGSSAGGGVSAGARGELPDPLRVLLGEVLGEQTERFVLEEQRLRQLAEVRLHPLVQPTDHQRVDAVPLERLGGIEIGGIELGRLGEDAAQHLFRLPHELALTVRLVGPGVVAERLGGRGVLGVLGEPAHDERTHLGHHSPVVVGHGEVGGRRLPPTAVTQPHHGVALRRQRRQDPQLAETQRKEGRRVSLARPGILGQEGHHGLERAVEQAGVQR